MFRNDDPNDQNNIILGNPQNSTIGRRRLAAANARAQQSTGSVAPAPTTATTTTTTDTTGTTPRFGRSG